MTWFEHGLSIHSGYIHVVEDFKVMDVMKSLTLKLTCSSFVVVDFRLPLMAAISTPWRTPFLLYDRSTGSC